MYPDRDVRTAENGLLPASKFPTRRLVILEYADHAAHDLLASFPLVPRKRTTVIDIIKLTPVSLLGLKLSRSVATSESTIFISFFSLCCTRLSNKQKNIYGLENGFSVLVFNVFHQSSFVKYFGFWMHNKRPARETSNIKNTFWLMIVQQCSYTVALSNHSKRHGAPWGS
jgi:hypothetical protein